MGVHLHSRTCNTNIVLLLLLVPWYFCSIVPSETFTEQADEHMLLAFDGLKSNLLKQITMHLKPLLLPLFSLMK